MFYEAKRPSMKTCPSKEREARLLQTTVKASGAIATLIEELCKQVVIDMLSQPVKPEDSTTRLRDQPARPVSQASSAARLAKLLD